MPINSDLNGLLTQFAANNGGTSGEPYTALVAELNADPALLTELNNDAQNHELTSITSEPAVSGDGGHFAPNPNTPSGGPGGGTLALPVSTTTTNGTATYNLVATGAELAFVAGHEGYHSQTEVSTGDSANTLVSSEATIGQSTIASSGGSPDYTSTVSQYQQDIANNESSANISGWNSYVSYEQTAHPGMSTSDLRAVLAADDPGRAAAFINPDGSNLQNGPTLNPDLTVSLTTPNVNAESSVWYSNVSTLGLFGNQTYVGSEDSYAIGTAVELSQSNKLTINFSTLKTDITQISEGIGQYTGNTGTRPFYVTDSATGAIYTVSTGYDGAIATVTSSLSSFGTKVFVGENNAADNSALSVGNSNASVAIANGYASSITGQQNDVVLLGTASATNAPSQATWSNNYTAQNLYNLGTGVNNSSVITSLVGQATVKSVQSGNDAEISLDGANVSATLGQNSQLVLSQSGDRIVMSNGSNVDTKATVSATLTCGLGPDGQPQTETVVDPDSSSTSCTIDPATNQGTFNTDAIGAFLQASGGIFASINGSQNSITADTGSDVHINQGDHNTTVLAGNGTTLEDSGVDDIATAQGNGERIAAISPGQQINLNGQNDVGFAGAAGMVLSALGEGDVFSGVAGDAFTFGGQEEGVYVDNAASIYVSSSASLTIAGDHDIANGASGATVGFQNGIDDGIYINGGHINVSSSEVTVVGDDNFAIATSGSTLGFAGLDEGVSMSSGIVNLDNASTIVTIAGSLVSAYAPSGGTVGFQDGTQNVATVSDGVVNVAQGVGLTLLGNHDALNVLTSGANITVGATATTAYVGGNGQNTDASNYDSLIFNLPGTVDVLDNSHTNINGDGLVLNLGSNDGVGTLGQGTNINVNGGSSYLLVGGNGAGASVADTDNVIFAQGGSLTEVDNSHVNAYGAGLVLDAGNYDTLGYSGVATTINAGGVGNAIYAGGNGSTASDANLINVNFSTGGSLFESDNSRVDVGGAGLVLNAGNYDTLGYSGSATTINAGGVGNAIYTGGNGSTASDANLINVNFSTGGSLYESDNSRVNAVGAGLVLTTGNYDTLGYTGSATTINAGGVGNAIYTGGNGSSASDANLIDVHFGTGGSLYESDNSRVNVGGAGLVLTTGNYDTLGYSGSATTINAGGADNAIYTGGNGSSASDANLINVNFSTGGSLYESDNSRVNAVGTDLVLTAGINDTLGYSGSGGNILVTGANGDVFLGGNGQGAATANADTVQFSVPGSVHLFDNSTVNADGNNLAFNMGNSDSLTVQNNNAIIYGAGTTGNSLALLGSGDQSYVDNALINIGSGISAGIITGLNNTVYEPLSEDGIIQYAGTTGSDVINWQGVTDGGPDSLRIAFNPLAGVSSETSDWGGLNATGSEVDKIDNWSAGGSALTYYDPSSDISTQTQDYTGAGATGSLTDVLFDESNGESQYQQFNPFSNVSELATDYSGLDKTGGVQDSLTNYDSGTSQFEVFDPFANYRNTALDFSGTDASGQLTSQSWTDDQGYTEIATMNYDGSGNFDGYSAAFYDPSQSYLGAASYDQYGDQTGGSDDYGDNGDLGSDGDYLGDSGDDDFGLYGGDWDYGDDDGFAAAASSHRTAASQTTPNSGNLSNTSTSATSEAGTFSQAISAFRTDGISTYEQFLTIGQGGLHPAILVAHP